MKRLFVIGVFACFSSPALAEFTVCNNTEQETYVSIGYKDDGEWVSEGWWTLAPEACEITVAGALQNRFYYLHAVSDGGKWTGKFSFCYDEEAYVIRGDKNCTQRGYRIGGFFEIDTDNAPDWTQELTN